MDYFNAIIFGIVQGITEFVPISSSGHLLILHKMIDLPIQNELAFDVALHLASLLAVILFFKQEIWGILKSFKKEVILSKRRKHVILSKRRKHVILSERSESKDLLKIRAIEQTDPSTSLCSAQDDKKGKLLAQDNSNKKLPWLIVFSSIPAATFGYFLEDFIDSSLRSLWVVVFTLIFGGILFLIFEKIGKKVYNTDKLNWKSSLIIGFAQALALIPGTSRSGITITAGLGIGLKREEAVRFSFLMSIPIILGASLVKIPELEFSALGDQEIYILLIAFVFSFFSAFLAIKYFIKFTKKYSLNIFAIYRFVLAFIILLFII